MDDREVRSKSDALTKAVSAREPAANILGLLNELKTGVKPSEELLRKTGVGKVVNKLKGLTGIDERIPRLAAEIVSKWRNEVQGKKGSTPTRNGNASPVPPSATTSTPKATETKQDTKPSTNKADTKLPTGIPLDKRTWKADKLTKSDLHSDPQRAMSVGLMYDGLVLGSPVSPQEVIKKARAIEAAVIALPESKDTNSSEYYKEKMRSLYANLKNKSNPELKQGILAGDISPEKFAIMTHDEMKGKAQKAEEERIAKENMSNAMAPQEERSISDYMECGKCKQKKVSFTQAQTRSADEPMTTFCRCENCGHRWKFS